MLYRLLLFILLLEIAQTSSIPTPYLLLVVFIISIFVLSSQRRTPPNKFIIIFLIWIVINIFSNAIFQTDTGIAKSIRFGINNILLVGTLYQIFGLKLIVHLERLFFKLTILSIPLYLLNAIFTSQFNQLGLIFKPLTRSVLAESSPTYWSSLVYTNGIVDDKFVNFIRNCGFMWEPGFFAVVIILGLIIYWLVNGPSFNYVYFIYAIALFTTFSTSGYIAFLILSLVPFTYKGAFKGVIVLGLSTIFLLPVIYQLPFISDKLDYYVELTEENEFVYSDAYKAIKLNRFQIALYDLDRTASYPFGYGLNDRVSLEKVEVTGTNGLSGLLIFWGVPLFLFFMFKIPKAFKILGKNLKFNNVSIFLMVVAFLIMIFSQNVHWNILLYLILLMPLMSEFKLNKTELNNYDS